MGLYNVLFGVNPLTVLLRPILDLDQDGGKWRSGRFRDIYLNADGSRIILYTRNGGGNRKHWDDESEEGEGCACAGCTITRHLPKHPQYVRDWDDDFDSTYAYVEFTVPEQWQDVCTGLATGEEPATVSARFDTLVSALEAKEQTEETKRALEVGKEIFAGLERGDRIIQVG